MTLDANDPLAEPPMTAPTDPNWRPDPTGRRLAMIRAIRRGSLLAGLLFGIVVAIAVSIAPPEGLGAPGGAGVWVVVMALPGLALLGAALTPAALGSRGSAAMAGLALGIGAPFFAVVSAMLGTLIATSLVVAIYGDAGTDPLGKGADMAGAVLRDGVIAAVRVSPLIVRASISWVAAGPPRRPARDVGGARRSAGRRHPVGRAAGQSGSTLTRSPRRIVPGCSTSPHTPNIRSLPSTRPR